MFVLVIVPPVFSVAFTNQMNVAVYDALFGIRADIDADVVSVGLEAFVQQLLAFVHHGPERRLLFRRYREVVGKHITHRRSSRFQLFQSFKRFAPFRGFRSESAAICSKSLRHKRG